MEGLKKIWKNLTVQWKWRALASILALSVIFIYQLNIKKTVNAYLAYKNLKASEISQVEQADRSRYEDTGFREFADLNVLNYISDFCEEKEINVKEISQSYHREEGLFTIETNRVVFEGNYASILQLIYCLEKTEKIARVNSLQLLLKEDKTLKKYSVWATIYIKYLKNEN